MTLLLLTASASAQGGDKFSTRFKRAAAALSELAATGLSSVGSCERSTRTMAQALQTGGDAAVRRLWPTFTAAVEAPFADLDRALVALGRFNDLKLEILKKADLVPSDQRRVLFELLADPGARAARASMTRLTKRWRELSEMIKPVRKRARAVMARGGKAGRASS